MDSGSWLPDPSLPAASVPDPDFIPAHSFYEPKEYRKAWDTLTEANKVRARDLLMRLQAESAYPAGRDRIGEYLAELDA